MEDRFARLLTIVFHPLFVPFYMLMLLLNVNTFFAMMIPVKAKLVLTAMVFLYRFPALPHESCEVVLP